MKISSHLVAPVGREFRGGLVAQSELERGGRIRGLAWTDWGIELAGWWRGLRHACLGRVMNRDASHYALRLESVMNGVSDDHVSQSVTRGASSGISHRAPSRFRSHCALRHVPRSRSVMRSASSSCARKKRDEARTERHFVTSPATLWLGYVLHHVLHLEIVTNDGPTARWHPERDGPRSEQGLAPRSVMVSAPRRLAGRRVRPRAARPRAPRAAPSPHSSSMRTRPSPR